jgi:glycerate dehydrogenase
MKIVILDGYTLNPGDLSWDELRALGDCTIYNRTDADRVLERSIDAEILLTNKTPLSDQILQQLPRLKYIGVLATGYNIVDIHAAKKRGIPVTNVPTYGTQSVAQMVFAHILNLTNHVYFHAKTVREGRWSSSKDFCYWDYPLTELSGLYLGVVGFGRIGRATAQLGLAYGMKVLIHDINYPADISTGIHKVILNDIFIQSDIVSLHCPLLPETKSMVNYERINLMKKSAFLINTSRGALVDEHALSVALNSGKIAGAGLDVLSDEPPSIDNPLFQAKNCFITPHISWATKAARKRLLNTVVANVRSFLAGKTENVINI